MPNQEYYNLHKEAYKKKANDDHERNRKDLKSLKINGCAICGYDRCRKALDFHHVDEKDKIFSINSYTMNYKTERIINELNKCILFCANCHREIHN